MADYSSRLSTPHLTNQGLDVLDSVKLEQFIKIEINYAKHGHCDSWKNKI